MKSIHEAMSTLLNRAEKHLTVEELGNLNGATEQAEIMAKSLAQTCELLGCALSETDKGAWGWFGNNQSCAALLWSIAAQADTIAGLVMVGDKVKERWDTALGWTVDAQSAAKKRKQP